MLAQLAKSFSQRLFTRSRLPFAAAASVTAKKPATKDATGNAEEEPTLVQVVYVTRHGLRTPLSDSNDIVRGLPWECLEQDETLNIFTEQVELHRADEGPERGMNPALVSRYRLPPGPFEPHFSGDKVPNFGRNCNSGQLTKVGHMQMRSIGTQVGERYKNQLGLLKPEWDPSEIVVRSTNSARTIETALELVKGMYPSLSFAQPVRMELHALNSETMYPHSSCTFLGTSYKAYRTSEVRKQIKDDLARLFNKAEFKSEEEYDFYTRRSLPALCNTLSTLYGHRFALPNGIRPEHVDLVCELSGKEYDAMYRSDPRMTRLGIGRFLGEITDILKDKVEYESPSAVSEQLIDMAQNGSAAPPKFVLMSGHDNTIAPLVVSLGILRGTHPPMGTGLAFELYQKKPKPVGSNASNKADHQTSEFYVQTVYNFQPYALPECDNQLKCPFDQFIKIVTPKMPANYHAECSSEDPHIFQ